MEEKILQSKQPSFLKIFACVALSGIVLATPIVAINGLMQSSAKSSESQVLNLNPKTDQTIFTTNGGLEIKSHKVSGSEIGSAIVQYFTLGAYNGTPLNWIVIGASSKISDGSGVGELIAQETDKQACAFVTSDSLEYNQVLVVCEKVFEGTSMTFAIAGSKTGSLPGSSQYGSGWAHGESRGSNASYYAGLLVDEASDYYTTYPTTVPDFNTPVNDLVTGTTLGLSSYVGKQIVVNSSFNSNYGFSLTASQTATFMPEYVRQAKDFEDNNQSYWCGDAVKANIVKSISVSSWTDQSSSPDGWAYAYGSATCTWEGGYVDTRGTLNSAVHTCTGNIGHSSSYSYCHYTRFLYAGSYYEYNYDYVYVPTCSYSGTNMTVDAGYRPAMVVDFSKF